MLIPKGVSAFVTKKYHKSVIRRRVNEGNDVYKAKDFRDALQKSNMKKWRFKCSGRAKSKKIDDNKERRVLKSVRLPHLTNSVLKREGKYDYV